MPKVKVKSGPAADRLKKKERPIHPFSRKALQLGKQMIHGKRLEAARNTQAVRSELLAEKLRWFQNHLDDRHLYTKQDVVDLVMEYRNRFNEELEQIDIIQSVGNRKGLNQHASRESSINITVEEETNQFNSSGIEVPDLINKKHLEDFKKWNGEIKFIQNLKLKKISFRDLERLDEKNITNEQSGVSEATKCDADSELE
ncbi:unnamed protein product [Candidula unifasciata]|uniref:Translation machinery-associated protein 16 n=1 Tax=Candidula unifasciata TaxID=100452 RepID=A0A8S3Z7H7_9EUPU|nr:unnamed protein product [Candidula unifasciata]